MAQFMSQNMAMSTPFILAIGVEPVRRGRASIKAVQMANSPSSPSRLPCLARWGRRTSDALLSAIHISISRVRAAWSQVQMSRMTFHLALYLGDLGWMEDHGSS